ncbi:hypothetical protein [Shewanella sp. GXUN23E]|uniref:hypothetical protein n=1 Tax=Shewanella sp. GXUN23E TaxID=3422498 RepID=UPI003D7E9B0F
MDMDILLLAPEVALGKFKLMLWLAAVAFIVTYFAGRVLGDRRGRTRSVSKAVMIAALLPVFLVWQGYRLHLDVFHHVGISDAGKVSLGFVYPAGKTLAVEVMTVTLQWQRGSQCVLELNTREGELRSVMTVDRKACRTAYQSLQALSR